MLFQMVSGDKSVFCNEFPRNTDLPRQIGTYGKFVGFLFVYFQKVLSLLYFQTKTEVCKTESF